MLNETPTLAPDGLPYRLLTLRNSAGMVVTLMDWGATLLSARVPMPDGSVRETLGCASPEQYINQPPILARPSGAMRTALRKAVLSSKVFATRCCQAGENQLHGGPEGFDKRRWKIVQQNDREVLFSLDSLDGDRIPVTLPRLHALR